MIMGIYAGMIVGIYGMILVIYGANHVGDHLVPYLSVIYGAL